MPFLGFFSNLAYFVNPKWAWITLPKTHHTYRSYAHQKHSRSPGKMSTILEERDVDGSITLLTALAKWIVPGDTIEVLELISQNHDICGYLLSYLTPFRFSLPVRE